MGVNWTGLLGFGSEVVCLSLCVASVFAPGSPFDPSAVFGASPNISVLPTTTSPSIIMEDIPPEPPYMAGNMSSSPDLVVLNWTLADALVGPPSPASITNTTGSSSMGINEEQNNNTTIKGESLATLPESQEQDYTFVILLLAGIISSRFGKSFVQDLLLVNTAACSVDKKKFSQGFRGYIH